MKTIHKYPFEIDEIDGIVEIKMLEGAHILKVECQQGIPCIWAIVQTECKMVTRKFRVYRTGHPLSKSARGTNHIATFQQGSFVWHMFEELE